MTPIPAMQAVVKVLESEGVDAIFGIPGASILPFYDALRGSSIRNITVRHEEGGTPGPSIVQFYDAWRGSSIRNITVRHEEGGTHAADGYSRATGRIGVAVGTSGPAGTNMVTGLYTAMADSIPILTITGQVPLAQLDREGFQAVDIAEIVRPVVKKSYLVSQPDQLPWVFRRAFQIMRSGRPGPVHIDLPIDVQLAMIAYDADADAPLPVARMAPNPVAIERALDL